MSPVKFSKKRNFYRITLQRCCSWTPRLRQSANRFSIMYILSISICILDIGGKACFLQGLATSLDHRRSTHSFFGVWAKIKPLRMGEDEPHWDHEVFLWSKSTVYGIASFYTVCKESRNETSERCSIKLIWLSLAHYRIIIPLILVQAWYVHLYYL